MKMDTRWLRNSFVYLVIMVAVLAIFFTLFSPPAREAQIPISDMLAIVKKDALANRVDTITVDGNKLIADTSEGKKTAVKQDRTDIIELLQRENIRFEQVKVDIRPPNQFGSWLGILGSFLPVIIFGALLLFMMRQAQGSNNQALSFGKSRARMFMGNKQTITFADVAGVEEAKQELAEVVEFLKYPEKFAALGARIPRGVLLVGPPGTGKTYLSRAVAGEAGVPFFSISGSEFVEMFVGVGASRVRDLFDQAKRNAPCIVFVDEIDAVGRQRGAGLGGSHDEREQTLNQILVEMDGFDTNTNVIVLAATNRPDVLDPALLRPGRFDRRVVLDNPDIRGRKSILDVHARGKPLEKEVALDVLAKQTPGFSGADLANLLNEGAILSARRNKKSIGMSELEEAIDRVIAGPERKSRVIGEREKRITAYHEVGHALVAKMLPNCYPVHKMSIVARGMAGGYTRYLPPEDQYLYTRSFMEDTLASMLGGQAAEETVFNELTTGASDDLEKATAMARSMVTRYGMSRKLGSQVYGKKEELIFLGRDIQETRNYSDETAHAIDQEVSSILQHAHHRAKEILTKHRAKLEEIAERLIKDETIDEDTFNSMFDQPFDGAVNGEALPVDAASGFPASAPKAQVA
ncbi:MAG: Cell division protein FtsH [uncultured Chloroflexi bacterium]|uniref:ATP-dependent zinc metalloprotease FtsH n=1 Tax=uncultured Chloroflexota bacterium TaxID=166587 RepID=A0A6J4KC44_9CHLR|nr:MAG: Cell division protein FtsH [uncultured Chloroflexota bacterium]